MMCGNGLVFIALYLQVHVEHIRCQHKFGRWLGRGGEARGAESKLCGDASDQLRCPHVQTRTGRGERRFFAVFDCFLASLKGCKEPNLDMLLSLVPFAFVVQF